MLRTCVPNLKAKRFTRKKDIQNLLTCVVVKCFSLLLILPASQRLILFSFAMKFSEQKLLHVNNICSKFEGQKINTKKDIDILSTCVVLKNNCGNHFTTANFDTLPRAEIFSYLLLSFLQNYLYVNNILGKFQG